MPAKKSNNAPTPKSERKYEKLSPAQVTAVLKDFKAEQDQEKAMKKPSYSVKQ